MARGTFSNHLHRNKRNNTIFAKRREELRGLIQKVYDDSNQLYGANKIRAILSDRGYVVSDRMVAELMHDMGLSSIRNNSKNAHKRKTELERRENVLQQKFRADRPDQIWVSDVTCFKFKEKYYYICVIIDLYSRKAISYKISLKNSTQLITTTFRQAYRCRMPKGKLLFHNDQGAQYTAPSFQKLLSALYIEQSFSNTGRPHDNAVAESFFSTMKQEELYRGRYHSEADLKISLDRFIENYNTKRPHAALRYKTPERAEELYFADHPH